MEQSRVEAVESAGGPVVPDLLDKAARAVFDRIGARAFDDLRQDLKVGFVDDRFAVHYQPVVRMVDRAVVGRLTNVQWDRPGVGPLASDLFLAVASLDGRYAEALRFILAQVCEDVIDWRSHGLSPGPVSITIATERLKDGTVVDDVSAILRFTGIAPEMFSLVVNEKVFAPAEIVTTGPTILRLADAGFRIAVRGVGLGDAPLAVLRAHSIDELKISSDLIDRLGEDAAALDAVRAAVALGRTLSADVLAAGVRTSAQYDALLAAGCAFIAGSFVAEPMSRPVFLRWLAAEKEAQIERLALATRRSGEAGASSPAG